MKTLLTVGCSFTDKEFKSRKYPEMDCSWPKWPELLGKKLGYNVVNRGKAGSSNELILRTAQDYLAVNKADMICVLWTEPYRLNIHDVYTANWLQYLNQDAYFKHNVKLITNYTRWEDPSKSLVNYKELIEKLCWKDDHTYVAHEQLRYIHSLDILGKYYNIPVYHIQGVSLWHRYIYITAGIVLEDEMSKEEIYKKFKLWLRSLMDSPYFDILDKQNNIWGWPFYEELGGPDHDSRIPLGTSKWPNKTRIGENDTHPNAYGHEILADKYYELIHK
jgi:hypothetical protein